jgi:hypothetical protein
MTLSAGRLHTTDPVCVARAGVGHYSQSGGSATFDDNLIIGDLAQGTGNVVLGGGTMDSVSETILGRSGQGNFNQTGGTHKAPLLSVGLLNGGDGTYSLSGGELQVSHLRMGLAGGGAGTFIQSGGFVSNGSMTIGTGAGGGGLYDLQDGSILFATITLDEGGTWNQNPNGVMGGGTFLIDGGTTTGILASVGTIVYNSGTIAGRINNVFSTVFNVNATLGDGFDNSTNFTLPAGRTITLNGNGLRQLNGTFTQLGNVTSVQSEVGSASTYTQNGGTHFIIDELRVGVAGAGTYNMNDGTLAVEALDDRLLRVGVDSPGTFNFINGRIDVGFPTIGDNAAGTFNHSGAGDLRNVAHLVVGNNAAGRYTLSNASGSLQTTRMTIGQNASGIFSLTAGTVGVGNELAINPANTGDGLYIMNGGRITAAFTTNNGRIQIEGGTATLNNVDGAGTISVSGNGLMNVDRIRNDSVATIDNARIFTTVNGTAAAVSRVKDLTMGDPSELTIEGRWDLTNNDLVVDYTGATPFTRLRSYIVSGFNNGSWNGHGLNSSAAESAASSPLKTGLGYVEATDIFSTFPATFVGQSVDSTSFLVRYTLLGDSNLDGQPNINDFALLASHFNLPGNWFTGDYNYNGTVTISDFALLASNFNKTLAGDVPRPGNAVPEPSAATGAIVALGTAAAIRRRRRIF